MLNMVLLIRIFSSVRAGQYRAYEESVPSRTRVLQRRITCRWPTERSQAMDGSDERPTILRTFILGWKELSPPGYQI